jgi:thiamine phosphate synthase YjbQ (UPF0047 family)
MSNCHSHPALRRQYAVVRDTPIVPVPVQPIPSAMTTEPRLEPQPAPAPEPPTMKLRKREKHRTEIHNVTVVVVNFNTATLLRTCLTTLLSKYSVTTIVVDNASQDRSRQFVQKLRRQYPEIEAVFNQNNVGHGPGMHAAVKLIDTPFFLTLDSDTEVDRAGFIERMLRRFERNERLYAIGWLRWVNEVGVATQKTVLSESDRRRFTPYVHPSCAMFRTAMYVQLPPFEYSGAPCRANMHAALKAGYEVQSFPVSDYVKHLVAGTRRMYQGRWDPDTTQTAKQWERCTRYPI